MPQLEDTIHVTSAAGAWWTWVVRLVDYFVFGRRRDPQQLASARDASLAGGPGEKTVMPDAVEAFRLNMKQKAAKELISGKPHHLLAVVTPCWSQ